MLNDKALTKEEHEIILKKIAAQEALLLNLAKMRMSFLQSEARIVTQLESLKQQVEGHLEAFAKSYGIENLREGWAFDIQNGTFVEKEAPSAD